MSSDQPDITLYTYFRSSCSARLRIALNLKGLAYQSVYVNLLKDEQASDDYNAVNPSHFVPSLVVHDAGRQVVITQSLAALEYLDERFPSARPLLPHDPSTRATARALADVIACDTQPVTNLRILNRIGDMGGSKALWANELLTEGLSAYEKLAKRSAGKFSVGDEVTIADICLVPTVWSALRFGVDLAPLETVRRIYDVMSELAAVKVSHWKNQEDTPEELRNS